jgi:hypothetical protein
MKKKVIPLLLASLLYNTGIYAADFKVEVNSLHYAVSINEKNYVLDLVKEEPNLASQLNKEGLTPLHIAVKTDSLTSLEVMLDNKINPNLKNSDGMTPLVYAIKNNKSKAAKILLRYNAKRNVKDNSGKDAIYYAKQKGGKMLALIEPPKKVETKMENLFNQKEYYAKIEKQLEAKIDEKIESLKKAQSDLISPLVVDITKINKDIQEMKLSQEKVLNKNKILEEKLNKMKGLVSKFSTLEEDQDLTNENILEIERLLIKSLEDQDSIKKALINMENELRTISDKTMELTSAQMMNIYKNAEQEEEFNLIGVSESKEEAEMEEENLEFISLGESKEVKLEEKEDNLNLIK